ncbi:MAG: hypothetical protein WCJ30_09550, partial [Deltaproteobacteria bacterium]
MTPGTGNRSSRTWFRLLGMAYVAASVCAACTQVAPPVDAATHDAIVIDVVDASSMLDAAIDVAADTIAPDRTITDAAEASSIDVIADDGGQADVALPDVERDDAGRRVPRFHRPNEDVCRAPSPHGNCAGRPRVDCQIDSDCTAGVNGVCNIGGFGGCVCSYDTCGSDSDCPAVQTCACHGYYFAVGNACVPGNCRVDGDCTGSGYCSPS